MRDSISANPVRFENGCFMVPDAQSLGTEFDLDVLESEYPYLPQPNADSPESLWR